MNKINDIRCVNPVETHCVRLASDTAAGIRLPLPLWRGGRGCVINYEL
ncbi:MAG: hypothetical protein LBD27_06735 [Tannerella sp.]|nr:hypothetical protein [Tannerella sp.]